MTTRRYGILGGGQLALMLADDGLKAGRYIRAFVADAHEPFARSYPHLAVIGQDVAAFRSFLHQIDILVFENEFISSAFAEEIGRHSQLKAIPDVARINIVADKLAQKQTLVEHGLPTSPFRLVNASEYATLIDTLALEYPHGGVLKWARLGYDGYGVLVCKANDYCDPSLATKIAAFVQQANSKNVQIYVEQLVDFADEVAIVACATEHGLVCFPPVVSFQLSGRCNEVIGPAQEFGVSASLVEQLEQIAERVGIAFGLVGTFAIEFFLTKAGMLLVNEIAPRVHNTGHYTQDVCRDSQFALHWQGIDNEVLASPETTASFFAMLNLLGPSGRTGQVEPPQTSASYAKVHWYGKRETRPGRKLGHINIWAETKEDLEHHLKDMRTLIALWAQ